MDKSFESNEILNDAPANNDRLTWIKKDTVFVITAFICGLMFSSWALYGGFHLGFTLSYLALLIATTVYIGNIKIGLFPFLCALISVVAAFIFLTVDDSLLRFLWVCAILLLYGIYLFSICGFTLRSGYSLITDAIKTVVWVPLSSIPMPFITLDKECKSSEKGKSVMQVILGLVLAFPIILIVVPLLASSDDAFNGLLMKIIGKETFGKSILKLILGIGFAILIFSLWFAFKKGIANPESKITLSRSGILKLPTAVTMLSAISVFYIAYLFSQLAYFFSAFSGILPKGYVFTAAQYARRGFFELCAVCFINLLVLFLVCITVPRDENCTLPSVIKIFNTLISVFSLLFTATAISKMVLYIKRFGLTRLRIFTSAFMIFLAGIMICVIIKSFVKKFRYMRIILTFGCIIGLILGFANPDKIIAEYNVLQYFSGTLETVDVHYLGTLSDAAVPALGTLVKSDDYDVACQTNTELYMKLRKYYFVVDLNGDTVISEIDRNGFSSYNLTTEKAKKLLYKYRKQIINNYDPDYPSYY